MRRRAEHGEHFGNGLRVVSQLVTGRAPVRADRHAKARLGACHFARVQTRLRANSEVDVKANAEDVATGSAEVRRAEQACCRASACTGNGVTARGGHQRLFNARVVLRFVVQRVRQDVRRKRGETDEQGTDTEVLETRGFDEHFLRHEVVRLGQRGLRGQGHHQRGGVVRQELDAAHFFPVAFHLNVVVEQNRREATGVVDDEIGRTVGGGAKRVARAVGIGACRATGYRRRGIGASSLCLQASPSTADGAGKADGEAGRRSVGVVVRVQRETRVRAAVHGTAISATTQTTLNGVALLGVVHANHHARGGVVHHAVQAHVAFGVVDVRNAARHQFVALGDENVAGNDIASGGLVGRNGGSATQARVVTGVALGETRFPSGDASGRRLVEQLLEGQPVGWEVQQQVAWQDEALARHRDDTARPMVGRVIQMDMLDLTDDRCPSRHGVGRTECQAACQCQKHRDRLCGWGCTCEQLCGLHV